MPDFTQATPFNQATAQSHDLYLPNGELIEQLIPINQPDVDLAYAAITTHPVTGAPQANFADEAGYILCPRASGLVNGKLSTRIQMLPKTETRWLNIYDRYATVFVTEYHARQAAQAGCLVVAHRVTYPRKAPLSTADTGGSLRGLMSAKLAEHVA